ncbi:MAG: methionyl-tRNA formyltransferase [Bradymonadales bacterium]|nr:MAG: methionyl-tRNA formyltransferase [Bradymonadales bacterium]
MSKENLKGLRIIFMGSPDFALPSLRALIDAGCEIPLVVTQPDRPRGRGQKLSSGPVKELAQQHGLSLLQPQSLRKDRQALDRLLSIPCEFLVVVAFGQILPLSVLKHPRRAALNVHASLLPAYRGAAPIARSILEGEAETGISIQAMVEELDMGDVLRQCRTKIESIDTAQTLHDRLKVLGAECLVQSLENFEKDWESRQKQDPRIGSYATKLNKSESPINFRSPAEQVHKKIMGLNPWPVAECQLMGQRLRVFKSRFVPRRPEADPGVIVEVTPNEIIVSCEDACVGLLELQLESRKRMNTADFLKGQSVPKGLVLGGSTKE